MSRILVVEDESIVGAMLQQILIEHHHEITLIENGEHAWQHLQQNSDVDLILLDRQLPGIDGMELLHRIKKSPKLANIPVVMETGMDASQDIREGLNAGAYYYLTKPIKPKQLVAVIDAALEHYRQIHQVLNDAEEVSKSIQHIESATFRFQTLEEARSLARAISNMSTTPERTFFGLQELLINAVEHGNLAISYPEKSQLLLDGVWVDEVQRRLEDPVLSQRFVVIKLTKTDHQLEIIIQDEGDGFDWEQYLKLSADRAFDPHGRGIALSRMNSLDYIEYQGCGNTVVVRI